jgi:hypothetical protein
MEIECKEHLMALLGPLFKCRRACYVLKNFDCWLLMKFGNLIFLFDPLGLNFPGKKKSHHRAALYRHDSCEKAVSQLIECIIESWGDEKGNLNQESVLDETSTFEIGGIDVQVISRAERPKSKKETKKVEKKKKCPAFEEEKPPRLVIKDRKSSHCSVKPIC